MDWDTVHDLFGGGGAALPLLINGVRKAAQVVKDAAGYLFQSASGGYTPAPSTAVSAATILATNVTGRTLYDWVQPE